MDRPLVVRLLWVAFAIGSGLLAFYFFAGAGFLASFTGGLTPLFLLAAVHLAAFLFGLAGTELVLSWEPPLRAVIVLAALLLAAHVVVGWILWERVGELWPLLIGPAALVLLLLAEIAGRLSATAAGRMSG